MAPTWSETQKMNRFQQGLMRLHSNWIYVIQAGLAAGLSYWVGLHLFGHEQPFFCSNVHSDCVEHHRRRTIPPFL